MVCLIREATSEGADVRVVVPEMKLSPNVGSDRSWVWNAAADVSEGEPEAQTLAIRFANPESMIHHQVMSADTDRIQTRTSLKRLSSRLNKKMRLCLPRPLRELETPLLLL